MLCNFSVSMDVKEVKQILLKIEEHRFDDEMAHYFEDKLFYDFVNAIKNGKYETKEEIIKVAKEVYKVRDINFSRWRA